jgi:hypothetical protein
MVSPNKGFSGTGRRNPPTTAYTSKMIEAIFHQVKRMARDFNSALRCEISPFP